MLVKYETIAACWHHAGRAVSLRTSSTEKKWSSSATTMRSAPPHGNLPPHAALIEGWKLGQNDPTKPLFVVVDEAELFGKCDLIPLAIKGRRQECR